MDLSDLTAFEDYVETIERWARIDLRFHEGVRELWLKFHDADGSEEPMDIDKIYGVFQQLDPHEMSKLDSAHLDSLLSRRAEFLEERIKLFQSELDLIGRFRDMWAHFGETDATFAGPPGKPGRPKREGLAFFCARLMNVGVRPTAVWRLAYALELTEETDAKKFRGLIDSWSNEASKSG